MLNAAHPEEIERVDLGDGRIVQGIVGDGFGPVWDAFVANFRERSDLGASCAVFRDQHLVAHLWGGLADARTGRAWDRDTAAVIFSCSKGILALCVYLLVQEGRLDLNAPVSRYWSEFGENGKQHVTVRQAMSHRAGIPALDQDLTRDQVLAWDPVVEAIRRQRPLYAAEDGHIYHALTFGWLIGEVIRRTTGQLPGDFFRTRVGDELDLRTWIGVPAAFRSSVAFMEPPLPDEDSDAARESARLVRENPVIERSLTMGGAFAFPTSNGYVTFNAPDIQAGQIPGANGVSTAESLARLYAACVSPVGRRPLLSASSIEDALRVQSAGRQLTGAPDDGAQWGTGFQLSSPPSQPMLGTTSFGHAGAGGQLAFADLESRVGFAYLGNRMGGYGDIRARELTDAVRRSIGV